MIPSRREERNAARRTLAYVNRRGYRGEPAPILGILPLTVIDRSAIDALHRMEEQRKAREDRMRNALEILAYSFADETEPTTRYPRFVRATAREGLGRDEPTNQGG